MQGRYVTHEFISYILYFQISRIINFYISTSTTVCVTLKDCKEHRKLKHIIKENDKAKSQSKQNHKEYRIFINIKLVYYISINSQAHYIILIFFHDKEINVDNPINPPKRTTLGSHARARV